MRGVTLFLDESMIWAKQYCRNLFRKVSSDLSAEKKNFWLGPILMCSRS